MKTKQFKLKKSKKKFKDFKFIIFPRYCGNCGHGFYLQKVPFVAPKGYDLENNGEEVCPDCYTKDKDVDLDHFSDYFLWNSRSLAFKKYEKKIEEDLMNLGT